MRGRFHLRHQAGARLSLCRRKLSILRKKTGQKNRVRKKKHAGAKAGILWPMSQSPDSNPTATRSAAWLEGPVGRRLLALEEQIICDKLEQVFGFQLLQIGTWGESHRFVQHSKTLRHSVLCAEACEGVDVIGHADELPIASDSVDAVILPHTLEQHNDPHQVLREVQRVLVCDGHVIIMGFTRMSALGLRQLLTPGKSTIGHPLAERRITDWLRLLNLEPIGSTRYFYTPPIEHEGLLERTAGLEHFGRKWWPFLNGAYALTAKKSMVRVSMVGPRWHRRRRVVGGLAEPATRTADASARQHR